MRAGDILRLALGTSIAAQLAILDINAKREADFQAAFLASKKGIAYLITHLMHPDEAASLRAVYGQRFFLIAANSPRKSRKEYLRQEFAKLLNPGIGAAQTNTDVGSHGIPHPNGETPVGAEQLAAQLIAIDAGIESSMPSLDPKKRLNVDATFQHADLYIRSRTKSAKAKSADAAVDESSKKSVERLIRQIFSDPFGTPTVDENAMAAAFLAAKSSAAMGRSVGSTLTDAGGSIISTGYNEVAKPGGGAYRENDEFDYRDHSQNFDPSDASRVDAIHSFLRVLLTPKIWRGSVAFPQTTFPETAEWLETLAKKLGEDGEAPSLEAVIGLGGMEAFDRTRIMHLMEFGRSVHAEVAALSDAFRRQVGLKDSVMYVTTFPCHECARNLVSFGVRKVFYVEPYGKSMAESLYGTEISVFEEASGNDDSRIKFVPFAGFSSSRMNELFSAVKRKNGLRDGIRADAIGAAADWQLATAPLRSPFLSYTPGPDANLRLSPELECGLLSFEVFTAKAVVKAIQVLSLALKDPDSGPTVQGTDGSVQ
ncbi:deaminase [Rathayibacter caricis]|nr:deaminase [Rathayibacter caricis]